MEEKLHKPQEKRDNATRDITGVFQVKRNFKFAYQPDTLKERLRGKSPDI